MNKQNKARIETIMMNAHTEGNGIKTALIPVDLCELSPIYQRDQGRHVAHIASNWDDNKAGHLEASERGDHFNIWDGGNRLRAAVMVGKTHVLCNIRTGLTDEDEAHLFVTQEENVTKLTQYDKFIAACASGEEHGKVALLLRDICDEYGIKIKKACGKNSAGVLTAISVALAITNNEPDELRWVFRIIREANWHMEPGAYSRSVIMALNYVYTARCDISPDELRTEIVKIISQSSPKRFEYMARACYIDRKPSNAMASVIEHYINKLPQYGERKVQELPTRGLIF